MTWQKLCQHGNSETNPRTHVEQGLHGGWVSLELTQQRTLLGGGKPSKEVYDHLGFLSIELVEVQVHVLRLLMVQQPAICGHPFQRREGCWLVTASPSFPRLTQCPDHRRRLLLKTAASSFTRATHGKTVDDSLRAVPTTAVGALSPNGHVSMIFQATGDSTLLALETPRGTPI